MSKNYTSFLWILIGLVLIILIVFVVSAQENRPKQSIAELAGFVLMYIEEPED